jgi:hypothetical protein
MVEMSSGKMAFPKEEQRFPVRHGELAMTASCDGRMDVPLAREKYADGLSCFFSSI